MKVATALIALFACVAVVSASGDKHDHDHDHDHDHSDKKEAKDLRREIVIPGNLFAIQARHTGKNDTLDISMITSVRTQDKKESTLGYMAIGFGTKMLDADIMVCHPDATGNNSVVTQYTGRAGSLSPVSEAMATTMEMHPESGLLTDGMFVCRFTRTVDRESLGSLIWAFVEGVENRPVNGSLPSYHGSDRRGVITSDVLQMSLDAEVESSSSRLVLSGMMIALLVFLAC
ncbi:MAG: hypothetical protein SGCHY_000955 [Lobulomycetales sp.]